MTHRYLLAIFALFHLTPISSLYPTNFFEIRAYCDTIETLRSNLQSLGANYQGHYSFTDHIYHPTFLSEPSNYDRDVVRLREYHKTNWNQKMIELTHKVKKKLSDFPKMSFDHIEEAKKFLESNYQLVFSFSRKGWEYRLNDICIYLEEIQWLPPTIELLAPCEQQIVELFQKLHIDQVVEHSVPTLVSISKNCKTSS